MCCQHNHQAPLASPPSQVLQAFLNIPVVEVRVGFIHNQQQIGQRLVGEMVIRFQVGRRLAVSGNGAEQGGPAGDLSLQVLDQAA